MAGITFVVLGQLHVPYILSAVTTDRWLIIHALAIAMSLFALPGITAIYVRQARAAGWLGLISYLLFSFWFVLVLPFNFIEVFLLPPLAATAPTFVEGFLAVVSRSTVDASLSLVESVWSLADIAFLLGGLTFGIASLRARVLSRWGAGVLTFGFAAVPVFGLLPPEVGSFVAVPIGLGLAWLGLSVWTGSGAQAERIAEGQATARLEQSSAK
jgi:hypothetical protein